MTAESATKSDAGTFRELLRVAIPMVLSSGSLSVMHIIDRIFLSRYNENALAAALPAGILHWTFISLFIGTATYVNTFVAQYDGAGKKDRVCAAVWQGVYMSVVCGLCLSAVFVPLAGPIFAFAGHAPEVQTEEVAYFSIMFLGATPTILMACLSAFFSGRGETRVLMYVNFVVACVNICFDYLMIFGRGPFPEMGIEGAATATVISQIAGVTIYAGLIWRVRNRDGYWFLKHRRFDRELFARLMRYGMPTGLQFLSDVSAFALFVFLVGKIGVRELAATNITFNLNSMAFIPLMGLGTAVMTLVGKRIGEGRPQLAVRTTWLAIGLSSVHMIGFAALFVLLPDLLLAPYVSRLTPDELVSMRELVIPLLRFAAVFAFFDGLAVVFSSAVRGAGDTRFAMLFTLFAGWSIMVIPIAIVWRFFEPDIFIAWTACTTYIVIAGLVFLWRFQCGPWKSMRVIEADEPETSTEPKVVVEEPVTTCTNEPEPVTAAVGATDE